MKNKQLSTTTTRTYMKNILLFICLFIGSFSQAQISRGGEPANWQEKDLDRFNIVFQDFEALDMELVEAEDAVTDSYKETPYRFGIERDVNLNPDNSGEWENLLDGSKIWRLGIHCPDANSISFHLNQFKLEKGAQLFVWNEDRTQFIGSFTHLNNKAHGELPLSFLYDDRVIIEYIIPAGVGEGELAISKVIHGYRGLVNKFDELRGPYGNSGACNINVNCDEGDDWQIEKRSVALILNGGFASCSGAMINNTANDGTPYFLTANHCLGNPQNWTYVFNHETEGCTGNTGPTDQTVASGALVANADESDFALIVLSESPPASYNVQYSGWDKTDAETVTSAVGIHHPSGDLKKICFEEDSPYHDNAAGADVWYIEEWEAGVTEGGSSGSPLFDQNHRIIGQLFGGAAASNGSVNNGQFDYYGRLGVSWDGPTASSRLRDWLDPLDLNPDALNGFPDGFAQLENDASVTIDTDFDRALCGDGFWPGISIVNNGLEVLTSATISVIMNGNVVQTVNWTGNLGSLQSDTFALDYVGTVNGTNNFTVELVTDQDENDLNNVSSLEFIAVSNPIFFKLEIILDNYGTEVTWDVANSQNEKLAQGGPYENGNDQMLIEEEFCLSEACYDLTIYDSYGDGLCCVAGDGSYSLLNQNNVSLASGGEFDNSETQNFCASFSNVPSLDKTQIKVFPNPISDELTIQSDLQIESIEIIDISGRLIKAVQINSSQASLDLTDLTAGTYIIRASTIEGVLRTSIIKE